MKAYILLTCVLFVSAPGCTLAPVPPGAPSAASADESPPTRASFGEQLEQRVERLRTACREGYAHVVEGVEDVLHSAPLQVVQMTFNYAFACVFVLIGYFIPFPTAA